MFVFVGLGVAVVFGIAFLVMVAINGLFFGVGFVNVVNFWLIDGIDAIGLFEFGSLMARENGEGEVFAVGFG